MPTAQISNHGKKLITKKFTPDASGCYQFPLAVLLDIKRDKEIDYVPSLINVRTRGECAPQMVDVHIDFDHNRVSLVGLDEDGEESYILANTRHLFITPTTYQDYLISRALSGAGGPHYTSTWRDPRKHLNLIHTFRDVLWQAIGKP